MTSRAAIACILLCTLAHAAPTTRPAQPGEHPRLLFTWPDERITRNADSLTGRRIIDALDRLLLLDENGFGYSVDKHDLAFEYCEGYWAAGHALIHRLNGRGYHAGRAKLAAWQGMTNRASEFANWGEAQHIAGIALAYDIGGEYWDGPFREQVAAYLARNAFIREGPPDSNYHAMFNAAAGLAALAIHGDPVSPPREPPPLSRARIIAPDADAIVMPTTPFGVLESDRMPTPWICAGPFVPERDADILQELGGTAHARPVEGTRVRHRALDFAFEPLPKGEDPNGRFIRLHALSLKHRGFHWRAAAAQQPAKGDDFRAYLAMPDKLVPAYWFFYTVVNNIEDRTVKVKLETTESPIGLSMWLASERIHDGEIIQLRKGLYPLLLQVPFGRSITRTSDPIAPRFVSYTQADYEKEHAEWKERLADHRARDGRWDMKKQIATAEIRIRAFLDTGIGARGWAGAFAGYDEALDTIVPFALALRNVTGRDIISNTGLEWIGVAALHTREQFWRSTDYGMHLHWPALAVGTARPEHRAVVRWALDRYLDQDMLPLGGGTRHKAAVRWPHHAILALAHCPPDQGATHPADVLPLTFEDESMGGFTFRNGWTDSRDFIVNITGLTRAHTSPIHAGDFTVYGRGYGGIARERWTGMGTSPFGVMWLPRHESTDAVGQAEAPNVVRIGGAIPVRGARIIRSSAQANGSGQVTLAIDHWVAGRAWREWQECYQWDQIINDPADLGISVRRTIAVDYSGKSGFPCLIAVTDRITRKTPSAEKHPAWVQLNLGQDNTVVVEGSNFSSQRLHMTGLNHALHGTVAIPAPAALEIQERPLSGSGGVLRIAGGDEYLLVLVVGDWHTPKVKRTGDGMGAVISIGDQKLRLEGDRFVFGD